jgi:hypothetical protein
MALVEGTNCGFVTVAPTEDPGETNNMIDTQSKAGKFTAPTSGTIIEIGWWCDNATQESNFEVGVYDDDGAGATSFPVNLDTVTVNRTNAKGTTAGWKKATVSIPITNGTIYWITAQVDDTSTDTQTNVSASGGRRSSNGTTGAATLATTWASSAVANNILAIYAVYTTGGAAIATPAIQNITISTPAPTAQVMESRIAEPVVKQITVALNTPTVRSFKGTNITPSSITINIIVNTPTLKTSRSVLAIPAQSIITVISNSPAVKVTESRQITSTLKLITIVIPAPTVTTTAVLPSGIKDTILLFSQIEKIFALNSPIEKTINRISQIEKQIVLETEIDKEIVLNSPLH